MTRDARRSAAVLMALLVSACAETTIDTPETHHRGGDDHGRRRPAHAALSAETEALSAALVDNDGQREALARIDALWAEAQPEIAEDRPDLLRGFEVVIELVRRSVERRRPADADKAHKNLLVLIAAYDD